MNVGRYENKFIDVESENGWCGCHLRRIEGSGGSWMRGRKLVKLKVE